MRNHVIQSVVLTKIPGSNGTILLAEILKTNKTITHVNISENDIGPRGAYKIAEAIKQNTTLTRLQMKGNKL